jgi:hypothetical protein
MNTVQKANPTTRLTLATALLAALTTTAIAGSQARHGARPA